MKSPQSPHSSSLWVFALSYLSPITLSSSAPKVTWVLHSSSMILVLLTLGSSHPPLRGNVNASAECDDISTSANPAAGATTLAMANINTLTRSNGTINGTNVHPGGSTMAQTANSMVTQGSFDTDLFHNLEQSIFDFDGATMR